MKRLLSLLVLLAFMALGVAVAIVNAEPVNFNFYFGTITQALSVLLVGAFTMGTIVAILINSLVILGLKRKLRRVERLLKAAENSISHSVTSGEINE
jgi:putative membrane protein